MLALVTAAAIIAAQTLPADLVDLLSKPVSCRTLAGSRSHWYPARQGDTLKVVNVVVPLRVSEREEAMGLDLSQHSEIAYSPT